MARLIKTIVIFNFNGICFDGKHFYGVRLVQQEIVHFKQNGTIIKQSIIGMTPRGITTDGKNLILTNWSNNFFEYNKNNFLIRTIPTAFGLTGDISFDGKNFWGVSWEFALIHFDRNGQWLNTIAGLGVRAVCCVAEKYLFYGDSTNNLIHQIDILTGNEIQSFATARVHGLTWDGKHLWCSDGGGVEQWDVSL